MSFDQREIDWLAGLLAETAAAEIMPRFRKLGSSDIRQKTSAADLVTEADLAAERVTTAAILARYPDALVVGEEACETDKTLVARLTGARLAFVLDPVDGTFNFACGVPLFGVMLAVVVDGATVAGIIHDPVGKDFLIGAQGRGSRIQAADGSTLPVHVADPVPMSQMTGAVSWQFRKEPERSLLARNQAKCLSHIGYRCAAHEYRIIASGHIHFALFTKLMPWDHLAGVLIHQEAGGYAARLDGSPYLPGHVDGGLLIAPDEACWAELRRELWAE
jgi:fructose-1,6-bisphosphatase/inositol monophosphatase family enzyme